MRGISQKFIDDLQTGMLKDVLQRVKDDATLDLEIRENYINIYYRGGNLMMIKENGSRYKAEFHKEYFQNGSQLNLPEVLAGQNDVDIWIKEFPFLKNTMDLWFGRKKEWREKDTQQLLVKENNQFGISKGTDYFICDIEYAPEKSNLRFDAIAVKWISNGAARKKTNNLGLAFIEIKYGDDAIKGKSGLYDHVDKTIQWLQKNSLDGLKKEMITVFEQKHSLGLINNQHCIKSFSDAKPEFIIVVANHDPASTKLNAELDRIKTSFPNSSNNPLDIKIVKANNMGYGLYAETMESIFDYSDVLKLMDI